jgi:hypothetical protein
MTADRGEELGKRVQAAVALCADKGWPARPWVLCALTGMTYNCESIKPDPFGHRTALERQGWFGPVAGINPTPNPWSKFYGPKPESDSRR